MTMGDNGQFMTAQALWYLKLNEPTRQPSSNMSIERFPTLGAIDQVSETTTTPTPDGLITSLLRVIDKPSETPTYPSKRVMD